MRVSACILASALCFAAVCISAYAEPVSDPLKHYALASKECMAVLEKAEGLVESGKWRSAYNALVAFDKGNSDPFDLAMKTDIALRGAVRTDRDRAFGLVDLEEAQSLESLRKSSGDYEQLPFDPPALAAAQAARGIAQPGILAKELGDYYCDVLARFSGQWFASDDEVLAKVIDEYGAAYAAGVYDGASLQNYAEALVRGNRAEESEPIYLKAIELESANAPLRFSYAMSLVHRNKKAEALPAIDAAIIAYGEDSDRVNAIALGARTATELGDADKAESYFALAEKDYPGRPTAGILRHMVAVETKNAAAADAAADRLVASYGSDPNVVRAIVSAWFTAGDSAAARSFLERNIAKGGDDMTIGALEFYFAVLLAQESPTAADKAAALAALDVAQARLKAALGEGPDNSVLGVIAGMRQSLAPESAPDGPQGK
jgi:tetratricopeptide (TPR) repeat protein